MLQDKNTRYYIMSVAALLGTFLLLTLFLSWVHGKETQNILFEREQTFVSSLMEQGISRTAIVQAVRGAEPSGEGLELLAQIGHTRQVSFWLFPSIDSSVRLFVRTAVGMAGVLAIILFAMSIRFLWKRERLYCQAEDIITRFSEGNFESHLPQNENGNLYQLFSAVEELAVALRAQSEQEQHRKVFLRDTISDISHQLKTPLAAMHMYTEIIAREPDHKGLSKKPCSQFIVWNSLCRRFSRSAVSMWEALSFKRSGCPQLNWQRVRRWICP